MRNDNLSNLTRRDANVSLRGGLTYLLIGTGIGAALALLFAPKSGTEFRGEIADVTRKGYDATLEKAKDLKAQSADVLHTVKEKADAVYDYAVTTFAKGEGAVNDAVGETRTAITEGLAKAKASVAHDVTDISSSRYSGRKSSSVM